MIKNIEEMISITKYNADSIGVLENLEAVRLRPGMYIGSTGTKGLHHLINEIVDNSIDEYLIESCDKITLTMEKDGSVTVEDNGRGIPVDMHAKGSSALRIIMTTLHAGGKFDNESYKVSGGLHGVGAAVVNGLSSRFTVTVNIDGKTYVDEYIDGGNPITKLKKGLIPSIRNTNKRGTIVNFLPDETIFDSIEFNNEIIKKRLKELSFLNKGLTLVFRDLNTDEEVEYFSKEGVLGLLKHINKNKDLDLKEYIYIEDEKDGAELQVAISYVKDFSESSISYCNNINTIEGGTHVSGFRGAFTRIINQYARETGVLKKKDKNFDGSEIRTGLVSLVSLRFPNPQYEGQTKTKLGNPEARGLVDEMVSHKLELFFDRNMEVLKSILEIAERSRKLRKAEERVKNNLMNKKQTLAVNGKLASCKSRDNKRTEIFIVEGDSAGGCFTGDTLVELVDGRKLSMKDILIEFEKGITNYVYSSDEDGFVHVLPITDAFITKKQSQIIRITLGSDKTIECTPEHLFMLRDGSFKEAQHLTKDDSLMSLSLGNRNHRAIDIEWIDRREDVYDITVPKYHNFALSAGVFVHNSAKQGRDREFQAILPLKGKPLNIEKSTLNRMLKNEEITTIISTLGCGFGEGYGDDFDIEKLKYNKIIIMADADVDGSHIRTLLLTFFFRLMPELIHEGKVFIATPPLYKVSKGKKEEYMYSDNELDEYMKKNKGAVPNIQRYKGLGEMNADQLWDTTLDPKTRVLKQVEIDDTVSADDITTILMGNKVPPRREFIEENAHIADLDL